MAYSIKDVDISRIYLANNNPRHDPIENEPEIIQHLIAEEKVKQLARHIASAGHISPLERIAVVPHPNVKDAYIAAEGNRRICALKLLADPDKADTDANKKFFRTLSSGMGGTPIKLEAVIFRDMETARPWMSLRHEGEQDGVGTRPWDPNQTARFNAQGANAQNPNIQASLLLDYARNQNLLQLSDLDAISITTMTRYLSNPVFRDTLGLADSKTLNISVPIDEFNRVVTRFLMDILDPNSGVNSRTKIEQRKAYANKLRTEGVAPTTRGLAITDSTSISPYTKGNAEKAGKKSTAQRSTRNPENRGHIIPSKFTASISNKILKRLYDELKGLDAVTYPFAATYLLRAVIEQVTTLFLKKNGITTDKLELNVKLEKVAKILLQNGMKDRELKFLRTMATDRDSRYSPDTLGHFVHGGAVPTHKDGIKIWDNLEHVIETMLDQLR
jgi:hypothetical protein